MKELFLLAFLLHSAPSHAAFFVSARLIDFSLSNPACQTKTIQIINTSQRENSFHSDNLCPQSLSIDSHCRGYQPPYAECRMTLTFCPLKDQSRAMTCLVRINSSDGYVRNLRIRANKE